MYICTYVLHVEFVHMLSQGVWGDTLNTGTVCSFMYYPRGYGWGTSKTGTVYSCATPGGMGGVPRRQVQFAHVLPQGVWVGIHNTCIYACTYTQFTVWICTYVCIHVNRMYMTYVPYNRCT